MADRISKERRTFVMKAIRSTNTSPELLVRRMLHASGLRFRLHRKDLPGKPDIVLPKHGKIIMVNGCFWHGHLGCKISHIPKSNTEYWKPKLARTIERDSRNLGELEALGWNVLVLWECEVRDEDVLSLRLQNFLT